MLSGSLMPDRRSRSFDSRRRCSTLPKAAVKIINPATLAKRVNDRKARAHNTACSSAKLHQLQAQSCIPLERPVWTDAAKLNSMRTSKNGIIPQCDIRTLYLTRGQFTASKDWTRKTNTSLGWSNWLCKLACRTIPVHYRWAKLTVDSIGSSKIESWRMETLASCVAKLFLPFEISVEFVFLCIQIELRTIMLIAYISGKGSEGGCQLVHCSGTRLEGIQMKVKN